MLIEASGGDYEAAAIAGGMSRPSLSERITGKTKIKAEELSAFASYFDVRPGIFFVPPMDFFRASNLGYEHNAAGGDHFFDLIHGTKQPTSRSYSDRPILSVVPDPD